MRLLRPAAARRARHGGRGLSGERYELPPERLGRWLDRWAEAHGGIAAWTVDEARAVVTLTGADGALLDCEAPFPPLMELAAESGGGAAAAALVAHAARERTVGVLLVRLGGHAAGVFTGTRLEASKTGARLVHGRHRAGGSSSGRFARRRAGQARVALGAAADVAVHVLRAPAERGELDAVVTGGDRAALATVLEDPRLQAVRDARRRPRARRPGSAPRRPRGHARRVPRHGRAPALRSARTHARIAPETRMFIDLTDCAASTAPNRGEEHDGPHAMTDRRAPLLDVDPELGQLLDDAGRDRARRELIVQLHQLAVGPWDAERLRATGPEHVGLLVVDALIAREVALADNVACELIGPGDVIRPWHCLDPAQLLRAEVRWTVIDAGRLAVLDRLFAAPADPLPRDQRDRSRPPERARAAARDEQGDLPAQRRRPPAPRAVLAPRRALGARVPGGIAVTLPLPHRLIAELVGARRPTVSTALGQLAEHGQLVREGETWLLTGDPVGLPTGEAARVIRSRRRRFGRRTESPPQEPDPLRGVRQTVGS